MLITTWALQVVVAFFRGQEITNAYIKCIWYTLAMTRKRPVLQHTFPSFTPLEGLEILLGDPAEEMEMLGTRVVEKDRTVDCSEIWIGDF